MDPPRPPLPPLAAVLPPLLLGTATFNTQYVDDPAAMPYRAIVRRALVDLGVNGFDTSPYYGPSETLLGEALAATGVPRHRLFLETKAGRVHGAGFDYAPAAVQASVARSLARLRTPYLDLVFAHDAEFVAPADVVAAVRTLRALRGTRDAATNGSGSGSGSGSGAGAGTVRYVGISGFPVDVLADLAERILRETGEPIDAVLSYGHGTVQNTQLVRSAAADAADAAGTTTPLARFRAAGVAVVLNASLLNMGLLTARGVDNGPQAAWHPSPPALRTVCAQAAAACEASKTRAQAQAATTAAPPAAPGIAGIAGMHGFEQLALRYALDTWARAAAAAGLGTRATPHESTTTPTTPAASTSVTVGPSVLGVTSVAELDETVLEWWSVLDALGVPHKTLPEAAGAGGDGADATAAPAAREAAVERYRAVKAFVEETLWPIFGAWKDFAWASPPADFVNELQPGTDTAARQA